MTGYILHIGTPKTGSTAIQAAITANLAALDRAGIVYPKTGRARDAHNNLAQSLTRPGGPPAAALADEVARLRTDRPEARILVSSEMFSLVSPTALAAILPDAATVPVQVIVYLRRQDHYVESFYKQKAKNGRMRLSFGEFLASPTCAQIIDYAGLLASWQAAFADVRLTPRIFDRDRFTGGDVVADFMDQIQVPADTLTAVRTARNISPSRDVVDLMRAARRHLGQRQVASLFQRMKAQAPDGFAASADLFDPAARTAFLDQFADADAALKSAYFPDADGLFSDAMPPDPGPAMTEAQIALIASMVAALTAEEDGGA